MKGLYLKARRAARSTLNTARRAPSRKTPTLKAALALKDVKHEAGAIEIGAFYAKKKFILFFVLPVAYRKESISHMYKISLQSNLQPCVDMVRDASVVYIYAEIYTACEIKIQTNYTFFSQTYFLL